MVVVKFQTEAIDLHADGLCAGSLYVAVSTLDVVGDDAEAGVLHQVVRAVAHKVVSFPIKRLIMRIAGGRASFVTTFACAVPSP